MPENPYQPPASTAQPLLDAGAPRRSTAGTVLRIVFAIPLLLCALTCLVAAGYTAYMWATGRINTRGDLGPSIANGILGGASFAAWAIGLLRRHRRLTWVGFVGVVFYVILAIVIFFSISEW